MQMVPNVGERLLVRYTEYWDARPGPGGAMKFPSRSRVLPSYRANNNVSTDK
jgi:hypothetical protein